MTYDVDSNENVLIWFDWSNAVNKADYWITAAPGSSTPHYASIIIDNSLEGDDANLRVTGFYVGGTTSFTSLTYCDEADFSYTPGAPTLYTSGIEVGHVTRINMAADQCIREDDS